MMPLPLSRKPHPLPSKTPPLVSEEARHFPRSCDDDDDGGALLPAVVSSARSVHTQYIYMYTDWVYRYILRGSRTTPTRNTCPPEEATHAAWHSFVVCQRLASALFFPPRTWNGASFLSAVGTCVLVRLCVKEMCVCVRSCPLFSGWCV